jgi:hypothetical protein
VLTFRLNFLFHGKLLAGIEPLGLKSRMLIADQALMCSVTILLMYCCTRPSAAWSSL